MQGENGIFHDRVANLFFFVLFSSFSSAAEFESAAHLSFVGTSTVHIEDSNAKLFVFFTDILLVL
jgi:hypothetical protein